MDVSGSVNVSGTVIANNLTVLAPTTFSITLPTSGSTTPITIYTFVGSGAYLVTAYCTSAWGATAESFGGTALIMCNVWNGTGNGNYSITKTNFRLSADYVQNGSSSVTSLSGGGNIMWFAIG